MSSRIRMMIFPSLTLKTRAPSSASASDAATNWRSDMRMCISLFNFID